MWDLAADLVLYEWTSVFIVMISAKQFNIGYGEIHLGTGLRFCMNLSS